MGATYYVRFVYLLLKKLTFLPLNIKTMVSRNFNYYLQSFNIFIYCI